MPFVKFDAYILSPKSDQVWTLGAEANALLKMQQDNRQVPDINRKMPHYLIPQAKGQSLRAGV
jgi:hypothetical protein